MKKAKRLLAMLLFIIALNNLSGCVSDCCAASTAPDVSATCSNSEVVLTDLTQPAANRVYILPDNTICPSALNTQLS